MMTVSKRLRVASAAVLVALFAIAGIALAAGLNAAKPIGGGVQFVCQAAAPGPVGTARVWVRCSDGHTISTTAANVDGDLSAAAAGGYATIDQAATPLAQRTTLNFTGAGVSCVDNAGATRTDCTIAGGGGSGTVTSIVLGNGLQSTQTPLTTTGTMSIDTSITVDKTTAQTLANKTLTAPILGGTATGTYSLGGTPTLASSLALSADNTIAIGSGITNRASNIYTLGLQSGASQMLFTSTQLGNTGASAFKFVANAYWGGASFTDFPFEFYAQAPPQPLVRFRVRGGGSIPGELWYDSNGTLQNGFEYGIANISIIQGGLVPNADLQGGMGNSGSRWTEVWGRRHAGIEQTIAAAATITLDPSAGETIRVTLSATAVTTINAGTGYPGEHITVEIIQDGTGTRAISGWSASFKLAGGAYTVTATASKRDVITFAWDAADSKWVEQSRSMNL